MEVIEVRDLESEKQFLLVAFEIYRLDPNWICPPHVEIMSLFEPTKNPAFTKGEAKRWYVRENGKLLGRIAAFYQDFGKKKEAGIGFFECVDAQNVSRLLFDTALAWLKEKGFDEVYGPINFGHRDSYWGLLVEGFSEPAFQDNYHPPYYRGLFEEYGFKPDYDQVTARITRADFNADRLAPIATRILAKQGYAFGSFDTKNTKQMAKDIAAIYNKAWVQHDHFVAVDLPEISLMIKNMKPLIVADLISLAYVEGAPAGFYISLRDVNPLIRSFHGRFGWLQKLQLFWRLKTQKPKKLRSIVFGVVPEHQNKGLETGMIWSFYQALQKYPTIDEVELSWVGDFNPRMLSLLEGIGAKPWKKHITFKLNIRA